MRRLVSYLLCASLLIPFISIFAAPSSSAKAQAGRSAPKADSSPAEARIQSGIQRLKNDTGGAALVSTSTSTGAARFVRMASGAQAGLSSQKGSAQVQSAATFRDYGSAFGVTDAAAELKLVSDVTDKIGGRHLTYRQVYKNVPVFAGVLKTHFDAAGVLRAVNSNFIPGINLNPSPSRKAGEAAAMAVKYVKANSSDGESGARSNAPLSAIGTTLYVFRANLARGIPGDNHLVWEVEVSSGTNVHERVYVDAHTLKVVDQISDIHGALNRRAYDGNDEPNVPASYPASPFWVEGQAFPTASSEANNMILASKEVYDFFFNAFNRDSFDGTGGTLDSIFDRGYGCPNATWNGIFVSSCPGLTTDDVTAHEWAHAYTDYTHKLINKWQPGALNEAYSDIWGETVDRINGRDGVGNSATDPARTDGNCSSYSPPIAQFIINSPASIDGTYAAQAAQFGPALTGTGVTGRVVLVVDDNTDPIGGVDVNDGCGAITNGAALSGNIALIRRGTCNFSAKVYNAQQAGAIAVVIFNNVETGLPGMGAGVNAGLVTIPSVGVTQTEGDNMIANLSGTEPNATMKSSVGTQDNSTRWLLGEDIAGSPSGALRDLWNPVCYSKPGKVSDSAYYVCSTADNGGINTNSGVPDHEFALLVDGGTYNGQTINAIGLTKAAHIFFRAQSVYQHSATDFADHADAIEQSANDLIGVNLASVTDGTPSGEIITAADVTEVQKAALAVELRSEPTFCNFQPLLAQSPPADTCGVGTSKAVIFSDNFEGDNSDWTISQVAVTPGTYNTPDWVESSSLPDDRTGTAFFAGNPNIGDCSPADDESGVQSLDSPTISIPSTVATPILRFDHWVAIEANFDGGQLLVSVDGGAYTLVPQAAFIYNAHNVVLDTSGAGNTNPRAGQRAFSGTDGGSVEGSWGTSVVDLSQVGVTGGHTVKLRFDMSQDGCGGTTFGWYVDNVQIAACLADLDMQVVKTASSNRVLIGDEVTYTIVATNNGPGTATSVKVVDTTINGTFVSGQVSQGSISQNNNTVTANFGEITNGNSATLTVVIRASKRGKLSNTAVVSSFEPDTTATGNNTDSEIVRVVTLHRLDFEPPVRGGCGNSRGTVRLTEAAPAGGVVIDLNSSNAAVTVPAQVTVPAGETFKVFRATTNSVNADTLVNVTATLHEEATVSVVGRIKVLRLGPSEIRFTQNPVQGGTHIIGAVVLTCPAPQDIIVTLSSNRRAAKPDVSQVTITAGNSAKQFGITTQPVLGNTPVTFTAKANGVAKTATLNVIP